MQSMTKAKKAIKAIKMNGDILVNGKHHAY